MFGDTVKFTWNGDGHNVEEVNEGVYNNCEGIKNKIGAFGPFIFRASREGTFYFVCGVSSHCFTGQKAIIEVKSSCQ